MWPRRCGATSPSTWQSSFAARLVGIDLHWLAHAHGALELARLYKELHPSAKVVLGGIASTYYHEELISYPQVDYVMRGYDTLAPLEEMMRAGCDEEALSRVPNLTWKSRGEARVNDMTHVPQTYSAAVNWKEIFHGEGSGMMPYNIVIPQAGCEYSSALSRSINVIWHSALHDPTISSGWMRIPLRVCCDLHKDTARENLADMAWCCDQACLSRKNVPRPRL